MANSERRELGVLDDPEALLGAVESAGLATWVWDVPSGRVAWSNELFRILGYDPARDEATIEAFFAAIHPDDRPFVTAQSRMASQTGRTPTVACRLLRRDGQVRHVSVAGTAFHDEAGQVRRLVGTVLDTTESLAREREVSRTAAILTQAQRIGGIGSWYWEPETGRIEWSEEMYRIFGVSPEVQPSEELFFSIVHPHDRAPVERDSHVVRKKEASRGEFRIVTPDGTERWVVVESRLTDGYGGAPGSLIGTVLDITQRKRLEDELRQSQKMEALGQLAGGIAHDFNNLLAVIQGSAELARRRADLPEIDDILQAADRAAALTRRLLTFSRRGVVHAKVLDLNAVVTDAAHLVRRVISEQIHIRLELASGLGNIYADPAQLEQVVMNLVLNARDAMPQGGILRIVTQNVESDGEHEWVLLSISDSGAGMDEATRRRAFEPFFTTKPIGQGSGLGLSTVFGIVTQSGGRIEVESEPNQGSTFDIYLPRVRAEGDVPSPRAPSPVIAGSERILLVEDDELVRGVIRRMLSTAGYDVVEAEHPLRALMVAERSAEPFDLLLTDLVMPTMSGRELARRLVAGGRVRSLLYMTGHAPSDADAGKPEEAQLHKPFTERELLYSVRLALEERR